MKTDSKVTRDHIEKDSEVRKPELAEYLEEVRYREKFFKGFTVEHIHLNDNNEAGDLAKKAAKNEELPSDEVMTIPSIRKNQLMHVRWEDWRAPIQAFLQDEFEPCSTTEAKTILERSKGYAIIKGELYKKESLPLG